MHFAAFDSIDTLVLSNVTLCELPQFALLISSFQQLQTLSLKNVDCVQERVLSSLRVPLNCTKLQRLHLSRVAAPVEELFVRMSETLGFRDLTYAMQSDMHETRRSSGGQRLLNANVTSLEALHLLTHNAQTAISGPGGDAGRSPLLYGPHF